MYIFLDESGDLGFGKRSSKWFLITLALVPDARYLERPVKKVWKALRKKHKHIGELHASQEKDVTRRRMLQLLSSCEDLKVMSVILNKKKVYVDLQNQKNYLYNFTANILLDRLINAKLIEGSKQISLVADRKDTRKHLRDNFTSYITRAMNKRRGGEFTMSLAASHDEKGLQAADFISWAIFRKYERGDFEFYELIKNKIVDERLLFP